MFKFNTLNERSRKINLHNIKKQKKTKPTRQSFQVDISLGENAKGMGQESVAMGLARWRKWTIFIYYLSKFRTMQKSQC